MSSTCIHQVALESTIGGSDKLYIIQVVETVTATGTMEYSCTGYNGRRGSPLVTQPKYTGPSKPTAMAEANKVEKDKRKKYVDHATTPGVAIAGMPSSAPVHGGASVASTATATAAPAGPTGPIPMLATVIDGDTELEALITDPEEVFQKKYDGERIIVSLRRSGVVATNRRGMVHPLSAAVTKAFMPLMAQPDFGDDRETVVDGELMAGDMYVIYDVLTLRDNDMKSVEFGERYAALETLLDANQGLLAPTAWTEDEKRAMLKEAIDNDWEGLMGRKISGVYQSGRSKFLKKLKLWATVTCRVLTTNAKRSVQVALRDDTNVEVFVGNVTVPVNQNVPEPDDLVEVRYLYAMDGGSLYQPTLLAIRNDIDECDLRSSLRKAPPEKTMPKAASAPVAPVTVDDDLELAAETADFAEDI